MVYHRLKRLDVHKGAGADDLPPIFIKLCAEPLSKPLTLIFNKSLESGIFPTYWKIGKIIPIPKEGVSKDITKFRPITLLSVFAKLFEVLVYPEFNNIVHHQLSEKQHGFLRGRSTNTNLVSFVDRLAESVDARRQVDVVYTDFSKAFDKVDHSILVGKMALFGISGSVLKWASSYLHGRYSHVVVNGDQSATFECTSGVPQGSHLGPLFFVLFINNIVDCFANSEPFMFADDLKIIKTVSNTQEAQQLQDDVDRLNEWCAHNRMKLNADKCYQISFTRNKNIIPTQYKIGDTDLKIVDLIRDLGVHIDSKLTFVRHVDFIISKASKMLGFMLRNSKPFRHAHSKIALFNALVRSNLEYCSQVWNPFYQVHKDRIERVQKKFLYHLAFGDGRARYLSSYEARLKHYGIMSLTNRRKLLDLTFLHGLLRNRINCPQLLSRVEITVPNRLPRSNVYKLFRQRPCKSNLGSNSPLFRMKQIYNALPKREFDIFHDALRSFKVNFKKHINTT